MRLQDKRKLIQEFSDHSRILPLGFPNRCHCKIRLYMSIKLVAMGCPYRKNQTYL
ncbi:hypothetical protein Hanom_Chr11g00983411 [Helianthus anomalus]